MLKKERIKILKHLLIRILFFFFQVPMNEMDFNILWMGNHPKPDILRNLMPYQKVNHFPRYVNHFPR